MKKILLLLFILATLNTLEATIIHEGFIAPVNDISPQEIIVKAPPKAKSEIPPQQPNEQAVWIPGYWSWENRDQDFQWICGVWRVPPPDHSWMNGNWTEIKGGWTWVRGVWIESKNQTISNIIYTKLPPPASQNEDPGLQTSDYFWCMGYWNFDPAAEEFQWLSGSWHKFDPNWVFVAAHWMWRPEGYLFVPSYWDWKLENRGSVYDCTNESRLSAQDIMIQITPTYPDYMAECCHYYHYQPQFWDDCDCTPIWWRWNDWWSIPWCDSWWLWWWYSHEGYPYPPFITDFIDILPPPGPATLDNMKKLLMPIFITPYGVPTIGQWLNAIEGKNPLFTANEMPDILERISRIMPKTGVDSPSGNPPGSRFKKPFDETITAPYGKGMIPPVPTAHKKRAKQILNIPTVQFLPEPSYNPMLRVYPVPVYPAQYYRREYEGWQNWDREGRRRGAHHGKGHHKGGGGKGKK